jgi:hypothetical protein
VEIVFGASGLLSVVVFVIILFYDSSIWSLYTFSRRHGKHNIANQNGTE